MCFIEDYPLHFFECTERVLSHVLRVVLLGMSFAGDVNCLAQVTLVVQTVVRVLHM